MMTEVILKFQNRFKYYVITRCSNLVAVIRRHVTHVQTYLFINSTRPGILNWSIFILKHIFSYYNYKLQFITISSFS